MQKKILFPKILAKNSARDDSQIRETLKKYDFNILNKKDLDSLDAKIKNKMENYC